MTDASRHQPSSVVDVPSGRMAVAERGAGGVPVLLVHGFPFDGALWEPQLASLSAARRVIAPDLLGFGASSPEGRLSIDDHADDLARLMDALDVRRAVVVGLSMGGYVALALVRRHADRAAGLALVCTRAGADAEAGRAARYQMALAIETDGVAAVLDGLLPRFTAAGAPPEVKEAVRAIALRQPPAGLVAALKAMAARRNAVPDLARIAVPTLVVAGTEDAVIPPSESEAMAAAIPGARLELVPGAGHIVSREAPAAFDAALGSFASDVDAG